MFERYTDAARRVIFTAREEAYRVGGTSLEPEDLLAGLLSPTNASVTSEIFQTLGVSIEETRRKLARPTAERPGVRTSEELPMSALCRSSLHFANDEADQMNIPYVGTEHLLLGILRSPSAAASLLASEGVRIEAVRSALAVRSAGLEACRADERHFIDQIEQIQRLLNRLDETETLNAETRERIERIRRELDHLRGR